MAMVATMEHPAYDGSETLITIWPSTFSKLFWERLETLIYLMKASCLLFIEIKRDISKVVSPWLTSVNIFSQSQGSRKKPRVFVYA